MSGFLVILSIIIPVYNVEAYVGRTLESVFNTTASVDDFEVIVVNDGTEDESMTVVRQYADRPNITIVEQENQGLSAARMHGLALAKGECVWFVDSDDYLVEDGVGTVLRLLEERPGAELLMFPIMWVYEDEDKNWLDYQMDREMIVSGKEVLQNPHLSASISQRFVLKRSLTENEWLFFPQGLIHEDNYFGAVLLYLSPKVHVLKDAIYCYRQRSNSIMASLSLRSSNDLVSIHKLLIKFMNRVMRDHDEREWFRKYCYARLELCYTRNPHYLDSRDFNRFAFRHGGYVWRQWLAVHPEKSIRNKMGRLLYFALPGLRERLMGGRRN